MSSSSGSKKRVRFSDAGPQVHEYEVEPKRRALDPMEQLEGEISGVCLNPSADLDAGQAAAQRAACRRNQLLAAFEEGTGVRQGDDVEGEEDYEDPEEMFDSVTGVPIEPFHLKREREEGYFDEDGTYVEYKRDEVEDAWADSLANVEVDEEWLARVLGGRGRAEAAGAAAAAGDAPDMSAEEIREHKRRVVDLLLPGENVLQALRRLAAVRQPAGAAPAVSTAGSGSGGGGSSPAAEALAQHVRALRGPAMPPAVREKFEQLTELSSVLMDQGEYSVHTMTREQLERSIQGRGSSPQGGAAGCASPIVRQPAAASASGDSGQQLAERLLAAAAPAAGGGGGGQNGSAKKPGAGAEGGGSEDAGPAAQQAVADADLEDMFAEEEPPAAGAGPAEPAQAAAQSSGGSVVGQPSQQGQQEVGGSIQRRTSGDEQMQEVEQPAGEAVQQQQQAPQADSTAAGSEQQQEQVQQGAAAAGGQPPELDGFVLDQSTGLWYNSDLGMYFDSTRRLFGDSSSGQWYSYDAASGQYTPVPATT